MIGHRVALRSSLAASLEAKHKRCIWIYWTDGGRSLNDVAAIRNQAEVLDRKLHGLINSLRSN